MFQRPATDRLSRRQYLAGSAAATTVAVAGCTEGTINWLAGKFLEDVNVFNESDSQVSGTLTVTDPAGESRLDETFTLEPGNVEDDNPDEDSESSALYADIWTEAGEYEIAVELDEPLDGETSASGTVSIEDPGDEMLVIPLGSDEVDAAIDFRVGDSFTDTWPEDEQ